MSPERDENVKTETAKSRDPLVGTNLGDRFFIEEVLGSGGMSVVYKAKQLAVNRHVAIKTIRVQLDSKPVYRERFEREISSLCALSHPNVVTVYDCIIGTDGQPYVVMDYLRGRSLETLIETEGPLPLDRFARISMQVCSAMDHAHKRGIIHRDLKPGNIVLMDDEMDFVKVVDFGLAKLSEDNRKLTQSGELWGSPPYMSPEQCMGESGDERSDIYALGCVMYEMLAGKDPFWYATTIFELIQRHVNTVPASFAEVNPAVTVPYAVESVIFQAMEKNPVSRFNTALELRDALMEACANSDRKSGELYLLPSPPPRPAGSQSGGSIASAAGDSSGRSEKSQQMAWFAGMLQTGTDEFFDDSAAQIEESVQNQKPLEGTTSLPDAGQPSSNAPAQPRSKWARPTGDEASFNTESSQSDSRLSNADSNSTASVSSSDANNATNSATPDAVSPLATSMEPVSVGFNRQERQDRGTDSFRRDNSVSGTDKNSLAHTSQLEDGAPKNWLPYLLVAVIVCAGIAIACAMTMHDPSEAPNHRVTRSTTGSDVTDDQTSAAQEASGDDSHKGNSRSSNATGKSGALAAPDKTFEITSDEPTDSGSKNTAQSKRLNKPKRQPPSGQPVRAARPAKATAPLKPSQPKPIKSADPWKDLRNLQGR
jgi:serine/threonine protein kinase